MKRREYDAVHQLALSICNTNGKSGSRMNIPLMINKITDFAWLHLSVISEAMAKCLLNSSSVGELDRKGNFTAISEF